jgi:hypothetical protein
MDPAEFRAGHDAMPVIAATSSLPDKPPLVLGMTK